MKTSLPLFLLAATVSLPFSTQAEDAKPGRPPGGGRPGAEQMDPAARLKMMSEKLNLTPDQQEKVKAIFMKGAPEMKELMAKGRENLTEEEKAKAKEFMTAQRDEIASVLTPEQVAKMKDARGGKPGEGKKK